MRLAPGTVRYKIINTSIIFGKIRILPGGRYYNAVVSQIRSKKERREEKKVLCFKLKCL